MMLTPKQLFEEQMSRVCSGDRQGQIALYHADIEFHFPFANDRPRKIVGRDEFFRVMEPLWARAADAGIEIRGYRGEVHRSMDDAAVVFAEFALELAMPGGKTRDALFVQTLRASDGKIVRITEYSAPVAYDPSRAKSDGTT